ncbi:Uncharacterised protein [Serratia grimesii]|nr:Uncharacterised protein [Serratia grimesii]
MDMATVRGISTGGNVDRLYDCSANKSRVIQRIVAKLTPSPFLCMTAPRQIINDRAVCPVIAWALIRQRQ